MINYMSQRINKVLGLIALTGLSGIINAQQPGDWGLAGPVYNAGRARNMIVDKSNSQVLYVGSASSGIFKSTNGGSKWAPVDDQGTVRNISYLAQSFDGTIYAGTGEGFLRAGQKAKAQVGTGLYKLVESGTPTLVPVVSSAVVGNVINRVACSPNQPTHIALATNLGIFVSTNGTTFNLASGIPTSTNISGQDVKFDSNGILYCTVGNELGTTTANNATPSKVYKSTDANFSSFTAITPVSSILPDDNYGRIELAIAPTNNNVIYASCAAKFQNTTSATLKGLFVSYDAGSTWGLILQGSAQLDPLFNGATRASGDYAHTLMVDPTNSDILYFGGYSFYVFKRTGGSNSSPIGDWVRLGTTSNFQPQYYLHENIHDIKLIQGNPSRYYLVTDAGVFRSSDLGPLMANLNYNVNFLGNSPTFQPFYKGLVTGQFNSVSIERFPVGENTSSTVGGTNVVPYSGFIGGTGGNGLTYYSGKDTLVTNELSYIGGEVYNAEYSKILSNAAFATGGTGALYRSTNVKISSPTGVNVNTYSRALSIIAPSPGGFSNVGVTTGTQFKLWESYGQLRNPNGTLKASPDSAVFYNDSLRFQASMSGVSDLTSRTTFTFSASRPNKFALIDSIVVRTGTVQLPLDGSLKDLPTPFNGPNDRLGINIKFPNNYSVSATTTTLNTTNTNGPISGPASLTLDAVSLIDNFSVTFSLIPFATKTITQYPTTATGTNIVVSDPSQYYRVFATVFYKYKAGDIVNVIDNNISTKTNTYTAVLTNTLNWAYGTLPSYTITAPTGTAIPSQTYVLNPGNISSSNPTFAVSPSYPSGLFTYSIRTLGTYTLSALPVNYSISAVSNTAITSPTYILNPGNISQASPDFIVTPATTTNYTITEVGTGTLTQDTYSTVASSSYAISSSTVTQSSPVFVVSPTVATTFTLSGISSDTVIGANTTTTAATSVSLATFSVGATSTPMAPNNKRVKIPTVLSARLAIILNNPGNTGGQNAIVVAKNPLALNDPLNFVRISQSGCYTDSISGNASTNTISIPGKPTLLEWSKNGTELYYATSDNKLYRVSHITEIMDLSPASYSGKFYTDVFRYNPSINSGTLNPVSPYRTTLVGQFESPISSISVTNDDKNVLVTLNPTATPSSTSGLVMYSTSADIRKVINPISGWSKKDQGLSNVTTYCSLIEKNDSKKAFVGTDNGLFYTSDITTPNWINVSDLASTADKKLPKVQIFDIKQQVLESNDCYNSGQIYVATNGRGVWTNRSFFSAYAVGVEEYQQQVSNGNNLSLFPNPTNGNVTVNFNGVEGETAAIQIMDLSGRTVKSENLGKLNSGDTNYSFETTGLNSGVYIVNISSDSGVKRVAKLVVTK